MYLCIYHVKHSLFPEWCWEFEGMPQEAKGKEASPIEEGRAAKTLQAGRWVEYNSHLVTMANHFFGKAA